MKRNLIYSVFAALLLASCSSNEDIPTPAPAPETLDAYLSLSVSNGAVLTKAATRAEDESVQTPTLEDPEGTTDIKSFTVAIFRGESTTGLTTENAITSNVEPEGSLVYLNTFDVEQLTATGDDAQKLCKPGIVADANGKNYQINGIKVKAGILHVLIMANMPADFLKGKSSITMTDLKNAIYGNLENEGFNNTSGSYPCSMSSEWMKVSIIPSNNTGNENDYNNRVYYILDGGKSAEATEEGSAATESDRKFNTYAGTDFILLTRNVSAIGLQNITLAPAKGWGEMKGAQLVLKSVFLANAVSKTSMTKEKTPGEFDYLCGLGSQLGGGENDLLAVKANKEASYLLKTLGTVNEGETWPTDYVTTSTNYYSDVTGLTSIGNKYFMTYENSTAMATGQQTLLVLCADYKYNDNSGIEQKLENRYYAVSVNDSKSSTSITGKDAGKLVGRNYIYKINLTIVGPGSKTPYEPLYTANATATIEVSDWTAEGIHQDVE